MKNKCDAHFRRKKIKYQEHHYGDGVTAISGTEVAALLNQNPQQVFKTLVTIGKSKEIYIFLVPVAEELDLKKAAYCVGEKSVAMIKSKELFPLTGYVHGGCSPIGMKKQWTTTLHSTAMDWQYIVFSGGKIGLQIEMSPEDLRGVISYQVADIVCFG